MLPEQWHAWSMTCKLTRAVLLFRMRLTAKPFWVMQEASTLLSGLATALSTCHITWPAFVPVHDPLRDAYWGIAAAANSTAHFDTDSIHISKNPAHLQKVSPVCVLSLLLCVRRRLPWQMPESDSQMSLCVSMCRKCTYAAALHTQICVVFQHMWPVTHYARHDHHACARKQSCTAFPAFTPNNVTRRCKLIRIACPTHLL